MKHTGTRLLLAGMALGISLGTHASPPTPAANATAPAASEVVFSGIKVGIDAETGKLRPLGAAESSRLDTMLTQGRKPTFAPGMARTFSAPADESAARATVRRNSRGGVSVKLPESQMSTVAVHRDGNGALVIQHADAAGDVVQGGGLSHE